MRWKTDNKTGEGYKNAIDFVNRKDIQYVCGYVQKKLNGLLAEQVYGDRQRPFLLCSKGMGLETALENQDMISENNFMRLNGQKIGVPRYFREKLGLETIPQEKLKKSVNTLEYELEHLLPLFESDMRKKGINLESPTLKAIRFEQWYNDNRFEFAKRIEMDFQERNHLTRNLHL